MIGRLFIPRIFKSNFKKVDMVGTTCPNTITLRLRAGLVAESVSLLYTSVYYGDV